MRVDFAAQDCRRWRASPGQRISKETPPRRELRVFERLVFHRLLLAVNQTVEVEESRPRRRSIELIGFGWVLRGGPLNWFGLVWFRLVGFGQG